MMNNFLIGALLAIFLGVSAQTTGYASFPAAVRKDFQVLPKPGEKVPIDGDHYFIFGFDKAPKLGMAIMRVEIFARDGKRDTTFTVRGGADMPSMRGTHWSGDKDFSLSAKGVYLLPVRLVMPGDWEISFIFMKNGKTVLRGAYLFDL